MQISNVIMKLNKDTFGDKKTNIYKQNPVCNGYYIVSELNDVLKSGYYHSPLDYNNVDWFVNEMIKLENKMNFYFKNTKKDIVMSQEDEEKYKNNNICYFSGQELLDAQSKIDPDQRSDSIKVKDHYHLTRKYRGPAHYNCNINVKQKESNFIPILFHNFSNYDCHLFFKTLIDKKPDNIKLNIIPKTNEEYISVNYGCLRFVDSYRFLQESS